MYKLLLYVIFLLFCQCKRDHSLKEEVTDLLRTEIVIRGDKALAEEPVTITAYRHYPDLSDWATNNRLRSRNHESLRHSFPLYMQ